MWPLRWRRPLGLLHLCRTQTKDNRKSSIRIWRGRSTTKATAFAFFCMTRPKMKTPLLRHTIGQGQEMESRSRFPSGGLPTASRKTAEPIRSLLWPSRTVRCTWTALGRKGMKKVEWKFAVSRLRDFHTIARSVHVNLGGRCAGHAPRRLCGLSAHLPENVVTRRAARLGARRITPLPAADGNPPIPCSPRLSLLGLLR